MISIQALVYWWTIYSSYYHSTTATQKSQTMIAWWERCTQNCLCLYKRTAVCVEPDSKRRVTSVPRPKVFSCASKACRVSSTWPSVHALNIPRV